MLEFLKHHWSQREKHLARLGALRVGLAVLLGVLLAAFIFVWQYDKSENRRDVLREEAQTVAPNQKVPPNTGPIGGPFTLVNQDGQTVTDATYRGKWLLVYFGYTYCPDMCPTGLQSIAHAIDQLGPDSARVQTLYITIDPARDTPAKLKSYVSSFNPTIVGLTGTPEQIAAAAKAYQVYYARGEEVEDGEYLMDHSSWIYLMDPDGKFVTTFDEEVDPAKIVGALHAHWTGKTTN